MYLVAVVAFNYYFSNLVSEEEEPPPPLSPFKNIVIMAFKFDSLRDIEQVVPNLAVDIAEIMSTHVVQSTGDSAPYSKETDVNTVGHYITDKITAAATAMALKKSLSGISSGSNSGVQSNPSSGEDA